MDFTYRTELKDFRVATRYGLMVRNAGLFRVLMFLVPAAAVYLFGSYCKLWPFFPFVGFIMGGYAVWLLILFGNAEYKMLKISKSGNSALGKETELSINTKRISIKVQGQEAQYEGKLADLACVIELKTIYLLYVTQEATFIVPKREVPEPARFSELLRCALPERFVNMTEKDNRKKYRFSF